MFVTLDLVVTTCRLEQSSSSSASSSSESSLSALDVVAIGNSFVFTKPTSPSIQRVVTVADFVVHNV